MKGKIRFLLIFSLLVLSFTLSVNAGYSVQSGRILDENSNPVQLRGVNWFGFETHDHVVHGLWAREWKGMITQMKEVGFNAVRLPFCPATLQSSSVSTINYSLNPDLQNKNSLEILDMVINRLNSEGMYVLLDHHRPDCNAISELWYTNNYSETQWINDLVFLANRYKNLLYVIGIDLKNEPHGQATWGTGNSATDWNKAAERASAQILTNAPDMLIFVEGIADTSTCSNSGFGHFWGENLEPLACTPLNIPANRLVLSPHVYGPDVFDMPYFQTANFPNNMPEIWTAHFGRFRDEGYAMAIGEFGGEYGRNIPRDKVWQDAFVSYLISKNIRDSFYWSWNANSGDTGGILDDDWTTIRQDKVDLLTTLWTIAPTAASVNIGGKVINNTGRGVFNARITMIDNQGNLRFARTNPFGYYRFQDVPVGEVYNFSIKSKSYIFTSQAAFVGDETNNLNFTAEPR